MRNLLLIGALLYIGYYLLNWWLQRSNRAMGPLMDAYRDGDYEEALRIIEAAKNKSLEGPAYLYFRGAMLHHLGKLPEAEASLRECIPVQEHEQFKALAQSTLGAVLMDQQRYPDAIAVVEDSIRAWPDRGSSHRSIAEIWLMQNRELTTALEEARHALEIDRAARGLPQEALDSRVGEDLATLAWAEAANGASLAIVEALLSKAEPLCVRQAKAIQAQFHYHAGRAYQLSVGRRVQNTLRELRKSIHTGNTGALPKR